MNRQGPALGTLSPVIASGGLGAHVALREAKNALT